jgi:hypothetical protein
VIQQTGLKPFFLKFVLMKTFLFGSLLSYFSIFASAQLRPYEVIADSIKVQVHPQYDKVTGIHRFIFGENYRKEWSLSVTLPVIKVSEIYGGLIFHKTGGGHQTHSLRFKDKNGKEWVLRSVEKYPDVLLPPELRQTFAKDWFKDNMSAQNPFSALMVPAIANAVDVLHTNPVIGWVAKDEALGVHAEEFANTVCLLEEREPAGKSYDTEKMIDELNSDNDNSFDSTGFLRARLLDLFIGDWDRHVDQWRWKDEKEGKGKLYKAVPKDRDQVLHVEQGVIPKVVALPGLVPFLHNYEGKIEKVNVFFFESQNLNEPFLNQFSYEKWMQVTNDFIAALTDSVLETSLQKFPKEIYRLRHTELLAIMKERRSNIAAAMHKYYYFLNKIVDIQVSNKNEFVQITDTVNKGLNISIYKLSKEKDIKQQFFFKTFYPSVTKEIRLFTANGYDSILINNKNAAIRLRIVGGDGNKVYNVIETNGKVQAYAKETAARIIGNTGRIKLNLSNDSSNTAIALTNPYDVLAPMINAAYNLDDGLLLGLSFKYTRQGFRKTPGSIRQLSLSHSFSTSAYRIKYKGEWLQAIGAADVTLNASAHAPNNTINFFGRGNESGFSKIDGYQKYYRARFSLYQFDPALRLRGKTTSVSIGPSFQYYQSEKDENEGRFINNTSLIHSYDSNSIYNDKAFAGATVNFISDKRNNKLLLSSGCYFDVKVGGYIGLNNYLKSFVQFVPVAAFYKSLNASSSIVIAERIGGTVTAGKTTFYQSAFLGSQENLLGYRQYRFAGQHMIYNNLEARIKLANVASYILPGQLGLIGFFDAGRVWEKKQASNKWHTGTGVGIYFVRAQIALFQLVAGHSDEGWYPYFTMGMRF